MDLHLDEIGIVMPRDLQLIALCTTGGELNDRFGITHVRLHPERAPEVLFDALERDPQSTRSVELPFELVRCSTTR